LKNLTPFRLPQDLATLAKGPTKSEVSGVIIMLFASVARRMKRVGLRMTLMSV
jgi:hypothetical protein